LEDYLGEVEKARDWHAAESRKRDEIVERMEQRVGTLEEYLREVEKARDWHAAQSKRRDEIIEAERRALDKTVHELETERQARDRTIQEMQAWRAGIEASWSWRLTRPLRVLRRLSPAPPRHRE
jgi:hypothetical protein